MSEIKAGPRLVALPHAFSSEGRVDRVLDADATLVDMLDAAGVPESCWRYARIAINGCPIPAEHWARVRPKSGTVTTIRIVPQGGGGDDGGKSPLATVLTIAAIAVSFIPGGQFATAFGVSGNVSFLGFEIAKGALIKGAVGLTLSLGAMALTRPPKPAALDLPSGNFQQSRVSPTLSITGSRNRAAPYGPVPVVFGTHRIYPPLAAQPYTETVGTEQYLRMLFCTGYGPVEITDPRIGETSLWQYDDVDFEIIQDYAGADVALYANDVAADEYSIKVTNAGGAETVTSQIEADELIVDLAFQGLVRFNDAGGRSEQSVVVRVEHREAGSGGAWSASWHQINGPNTTDDGEGGVIIQDALGDLTAGSATIQGASRTTYTTTAKVDADFRLLGSRAGGRVTFSEPLAGVVDPSTQSIPYKTVDATLHWRVAGSGDAFQATGIVNGQAINPAGMIGRQIEFAVSARTVFNGIEYEQIWGLPFTSVEYLNVPGAAGTTSDIRFRASDPNLVRAAVHIKPPARGQYDVRVTRVSDDNDDNDKIRDALFVSGLKTVTYRKPVTKTGIGLFALKIKASEQLNGVIDEFNCIVRRKVQVYDGSSWSLAFTQNAAWAYADVLIGRAAGRKVATSRLDAAGLKAWADACAAENRTFNAVVDYRTTKFELLGDIASAGRAAFGMRDGLFSVVRDVEQTTPVQLFTPRNVISFKSTKQFRQAPHAIRARFISAEEGYKERERTVYDDGYSAANATRFESMEFFGITDPETVWKDARYFMAVGRLRPEVYELQVDIDHLVCERGDMVRVQYDVPKWGLASGRIKSVTVDGGGAVTAMTVDETLSMDGSSAYALRIILSDGSVVLATPDTVNGDVTSLTFSTPIPAGDAPAAGDLFAFGLAGSETVELIVRDIEPREDFRAKLTLLDHAPAVHDAETGEIPAYDPQITQPGEFSAPGPVAITSALEYETRDSRARPYAISFAWTAGAGLPGLFEVYRGMTATGPWSLVQEAADQTYSATGLSRGETVHLAVVGVGRGGRKLPLAAATKRSVTVQGSPPSDVATFRGAVVDGALTLDWTHEDSKTVKYRIRYSSATSGADWAGAVDLIPAVAYPASSVSVPALIGSYLIKAVDVDGVESDGALTYVLATPGLNSLNVVETATENPGFAGAKSDVDVADAGLVLTSADLFDEAPGLFDDAPGLFDAGGESGFAASGTYNFAQAGGAVIDLGAVYTSRVTASVEATLASYLGLFDDASGLFDAMPGLFDAGGVGASDGGIELQIRTTEDDPSGSPTWSAWERFFVGDYRARAFDLRAVLTRPTDQTHLTPRVTALGVTVDMPDRVEAASDVSSGATTKSVTFARAFRVAPTVVVDPQDMASGDYVEKGSVTATGFDVTFRDSGGTAVDRTFDWVAKGYGAVEP